MKISLILPFLAVFSPIISISASVEPLRAPEGISTLDWSDIHKVYESNRHGIVTNNDGTNLAHNPSQAWATKFNGRGFIITPYHANWSWGLELVSYGEIVSSSQTPNNISKLKPEICSEGTKISYLWNDAITEWFINDARGLEQGWTISRRLDQPDSNNPLLLSLAIHGNLRPKISTDESNITFLNDSDEEILNYGGLKAWDADGKPLHTYFELGEGPDALLSIVVDDTVAKYPITIDPIAQNSNLKASNAEAGDRFGMSVAVSGDTVVVGADSEDSGANGVDGNQADNSVTNSGAAYIFVRSGATWVQQAYLKASNPEASDNFGNSVSVSGNTVVIGAIYEDSVASGVDGSQTDNSATDSGAAYVFVRNGSIWTQQAYLKASNTDSNDRYGMTVAVSGETIVVGAIWEDSSAVGMNGNQADNSASNAGAAYVFARDGSSWSQQAYLKPSNTGAGDRFGWSVAISNTTVVVGSKWEDSSVTGIQGDQTDNNAPDSGAAYIFVRNGTTWSQQAYLKPSNTEAGDNFGYCVGVSNDTVVVGSFYEDSSATGINGDQMNNLSTDSGAAYVFVRNGGSWMQQAYLKSSNSKPYCRFSKAVAISGESIVVGAYDEASGATGVDGNQTDSSSPYSGAAYLFVRCGSYWQQKAYLKASNTGGSDYFGWSVSISGNTLVIGALYEDSNGIAPTDNSAGDSGAAYVFADAGPYSLSTNAVHGSVLGGTGDYAAGTTLSLSAAPLPGYVFLNWTGSSAGISNPLSVLMDTNKTIIANFVPDTADPDEDGLSTYREVVIYGTNPTKKDSDDDGFDDPFEINTGFDPMLATSTPDSSSSIRTAMEFRFNAATGVSYRIEASTDLNVWEAVEDGIIGQGGSVTRFYSIEDQPHRYFRVKKN